MPHTTNLPLLSDDQASPAVQRLFDQYRQAFGRSEVPGILRCFATHPPLLEHMLGLARTMLFVDGSLGRQHKELLAAFVSATNLCDYCADSHAAAFCSVGGDRAAALAALSLDPDSPAFTTQQHALLHFARCLSANSHSIRPHDIDLLREAGFDELQIAEAIHVIALFAAFNRIVSGFGLPSQHLFSAASLMPEQNPATSQEPCSHD